MTSRSGEGNTLPMVLNDSASIAKVLWKTLPDVVVHTAAMSSPRACEEHPDLAFETNCPGILIECMFAVVPDALLVHFSTDIVLEGSDDAYGDGGRGLDRARAMIESARPLNAYGKSKLAFERMLLDWPRCVVFRMSNAIGPPAPERGDGKFLQWLHTQLLEKKEVDVWYNETRSFVDVRQVVEAVRKAIEKYGVAHQSDAARVDTLEQALLKPSDMDFYERDARRTYPPVFLHLNLGGPESLSRLDLARQLVQLDKRIDPNLVRASSRPPSLNSPQYINLDSSNLQRHLGVTTLITLKDAIANALATS